MTAKCANPSCNEPFHYFRTGKIYLIDVPNAIPSLHARRPPEYFWLCGECCRVMRVSLDQSGSVVVERDIVAEAVA
jgi:hypothetical protein